MIRSTKSHQLGDRSSAFGDNDLLTSSGDVEISTELRLETGHPDLRHVTIMVSSKAGGQCTHVV